MQSPYIKAMMLDTLDAWLMDPASAYFAWQKHEAEGANRRPFATRSVTQHRAMFDRFLRFLGERGRTVATFGPDHLGAFLDAGGGFEEDTATRIRYAKLVDRLCRHLVEIGLRGDNPGFEILVRLQWPQGEPRPAHLSEDADVRLQAYLQPQLLEDERALRNHAMVATLLATGVTAAEFLRLTIADVWLTGAQPYVSATWSPCCASSAGASFG
jgi:integrase/recombinase XerD